MLNVIAQPCLSCAKPELYSKSSRLFQSIFQSATVWTGGTRRTVMALIPVIVLWVATHLTSTNGNSISYNYGSGPTSDLDQGEFIFNIYCLNLMALHICLECWEAWKSQPHKTHQSQQKVLLCLFLKYMRFVHYLRDNWYILYICCLFNTNYFAQYIKISLRRHKVPFVVMYHT